jgi:DNA polymerase III alpha subunit
MRAYAELAVTTNFSFLRGASHPQEMLATADALGLTAIGIADRNSFAGAVRAYDEARKRNIKLLVGTRLVTIDGFEALAYPADRSAYGRLCRLLTKGNLEADKGEFHRAAAARVSRAQRSMERIGMLRCRPGIVTHSEFATIPDQRCSISCRILSGKQV